MSIKKIKLHPIKADGSQDKDIDLYPKTSTDQVVGLDNEINRINAKIDTKQNKITPENPLPASLVDGLEEELTDFVRKETKIAGTEIGEGIDYLRDLQYDKVQKTIIVPGVIVDGETYTLPKTYDISKFDFPTGEPEMLYMDETENGKVIWLDQEEIALQDGISSVYYYREDNDQFNWYVYDIESHEETIYDGDITLVLNEASIIEGNENTLKLVLGIEDNEETIEVDQSIKEKVEDLPNWNYEKKVEVIKGFQKGKTYYLKSSFTEEETNNFYSQIDYNGSAVGYQVYDSTQKRFSNYVNNNNKTCIGLYRNDINKSILYDFERETWVDIYQRDEQGLYLPIPYDKENPIFQFIFDVDGEFNNGEDVPYKNYDLYLLKQLLVNEDDSEIVDITREYEVSLKDNLDNYKNWKYDQKNQYKYVLKENIDWDKIKELYDPNNYKFYEYYDGQTTRSMYIYTVDKNNITYYYIQIYNYYDWQSYYIFEEDGGYNNKDYVKKDIWYSFYNYYIHVEMPQEVEINESGIKNQEMFDLIFDKVPIYETLGEKIEDINNQVKEIKEDLDNGLKDNLYENLEQSYKFYERPISSSNKIALKVKNYLDGDLDSSKITQIIDNTYYSYDKEYSNYACPLLLSKNISVYYVNIDEHYSTWSSRWYSYIYVITKDNIYRLCVRNYNSGFLTNMYWQKRNKTNGWDDVQGIEFDANILGNSFEYGKNPNWSYEDFENTSFYKLDSEVPYSLLSEEPSGWDYIYNAFFYEDSGDYYRINQKKPVTFEEDTYYTQLFERLDEEPSDWDSNKENYFCDSFAWELIQEIFKWVEYIPQTLEEKFESIEEEIESHTDDSYLKDRIYGMSNKIILTDGEEYSLNDDYTSFFNKYSTSSSTVEIYNELNVIINNGIDDGGQISPDPGMLTNSVSDGGKGVTKVVNPNLETEETDYIKVIVFANLISPTPTPKGEGIKDGGAVYDGGGAIEPLYPVFGASFIDVYTSNDNNYRYYVASDSWINSKTDELVPIEEMPKIKLSTTSIKDYDMFKDVLGGKEITLEEKLSEGIKDWNYEVKIGESGVKPIFDNASIIQKNGELFYDAGLTTDQTNTYLYSSNNFIILYSYFVSQNVIHIKYVTPDFTTQTLKMYVNVLSAGIGGFVSEWSYKEEPFNSSLDVIYDETPITSQEELPFIPDYNINNITEKPYIQIIELLVRNFSKLENITLEEKILDLPNWLYKYQKGYYELLSVPNWEGMGEALNDWYNIYSYEHTDSGFSDSIYIGEISNGHSGVAFEVVYEDTGKQYEIYNEDWIDSSADDFEVKANTYYRVEYVYQPSYKKSYIEEKPELEIHKEAIKDQDLFNCVYQYTPEQKQTLDEKINEDLKDKTYGTKIDETKKAFKTSIDWSAFEDLENGMNLIYGVDENTPEFPIISILKATSSDNTSYIITYTLYTDSENPSKQIAYGYTNSSAGNIEPNVWNYIDTTGEEPIIREEVPQSFVYDSEKIKDLTHFNFICEDIAIKQTLDEKLNEIETLAITSEINVNDWEQTVNPIIVSTYPYQATIQNDNLIKSIKCEVEFGLNEILSENYAPYYECDNETGELIIFTKQIPQSNINIKIIRWLGKTIINS